MQKDEATKSAKILKLEQTKPEGFKNTKDQPKSVIRKSKSQIDNTTGNGTKRTSTGTKINNPTGGGEDEENKIKFTFGNCHGGIVSRKTPIIAEITSLAMAEKADFIIMTEAGVPHNTYPFMTGYEPVGTATAITGKISHAGVAIYKSNKFKENPKYVQSLD